MIEFENFNLAVESVLLENLNLRVDNGEIVCLLANQPRLWPLLGLRLSGFCRWGEGGLRLDGGGAGSHADSLAYVERLLSPADFETEAALSGWLRFLDRAAGVSTERVWQTLIRFNLRPEDQRQRLSDLPADQFKAFYLAVRLAGDARNIVIHDFCKGAEKSFELKFNRLLLQKKEQGAAILYLSDDIFYASEIADRVGFIKAGRLLLETSAVDLKEMDFQELYRKFLS